MAVLYEDLTIEIFAIATPKFKTLDSTDPRYRRLYFIRRAVATLVEFGGALVQLNECPEFRLITASFGKSDIRRWNNVLEFFEQHKDTLKNVRNDIGGHFQMKAASYALENIDPSATAQIEIVRGPSGGAGVKLRFAGELAATALTAHRESKSTKEFIEHLVKLTREGFEQAVIAAHIVVDNYLLPRIRS